MKNYARPAETANYGDLAEVPPELEWLANLTNPKTRRAYKIDVEEFIAFAGLGGIAELRAVTRAHVIAWRKDLEKHELAHSSIRRKLSALSALFDYLCEHNAVAGNPVDVAHTPTGAMNLFAHIVASASAIPEGKAGRLLHYPFRGLLSVHLRYGPHAHRVAFATLCTEGFSGFISSTVASIVTGRNEPVPGRDFHPLWINTCARRTFGLRLIHPPLLRTWPTCSAALLTQDSSFAASYYESLLGQPSLAIKQFVVSCSTP